MFLRSLAFAAALLAVTSVYAQEAVDDLPDLRDRNGVQIPPDSAWLDLRQNAGAYSTPQSAPRWVESVTLVASPAQGDKPAGTVFRIRVIRPTTGMQLLLVRLFFDDKPEKRPVITAWDESGSQIIQSGPLGAGIDLPTSDTVLVPMIGASCVDVEVAGDGATVRGAFLDWMTSRKVAHPLSAEGRDVM
ncbi:MAG TPA: hypothetical protein VK474_01955, partial [Chthoniobacterales bacterium]|nr:hypothetical protein [Chthoniobacterales bacterium]